MNLQSLAAAAWLLPTPGRRCAMTEYPARARFFTLAAAPGLPCCPGATLLELATRVELPSGGQQYQDLRAGRLPLVPTCTRRFAGMVK